MIRLKYLIQEAESPFFCYWLSKDGVLLNSGKDHRIIANRYTKNALTDDEIYEEMFHLGFARIIIESNVIYVNTSLDSNHVNLTFKQKDKLLDLSFQKNKIIKDLQNNQLQLTENTEYKGVHEAPGKNNGAPLYDLTVLYPDDVYGPNGPQYYGDNRGDSKDRLTFAIIHSVHNKPNKMVTAYRAVPSIITTAEKIRNLEFQRGYIMKYGKIPKDVKTRLDRSSYYEYICNELDKLRSMVGNENEEKVTINPGDWVTVNKYYAKEHGESSLLGKYKIISKSVPAKTLFTFADTIHEWGYDP